MNYWHRIWGKFYLFGQMKITVFPLLFVTLFFLDCERERSIDSIFGTWVVESYTDHEKNITIGKEDVESWNGMDVVLKLMTDSLCGTNTTNSIFGSFTLDNNNIHVITYGGTKVGQPEWGNMFSDIVFDLKTYIIQNNRLIITYNNNKNSVTLRPETKCDPCRDF